MYSGFSNESASCHVYVSAIFVAAATANANPKDEVEPALIEAVRNDDPEPIRSFLESGGNPNKVVEVARECWVDGRFLWPPTGCDDTGKTSPFLEPGWANPSANPPCLSASVRDRLRACRLQTPQFVPQRVPDEGTVFYAFAFSASKRCARR